MNQVLSVKDSSEDSQSTFSLNQKRENPQDNHDML